MTGNQFSAMMETRAESIAGNFALCRYHSKHLALRTFFSFPWIVSNKCAMVQPTEIKAIEEGLFDEKRYSFETQ